MISISALGARLVAWVAGTKAGMIAAGLFILAVVVKVSNVMGARRGAADEREDARYADHDRAEDVRARLRDVARNPDGRPVDDRLREGGQFRD